MNQSAVEERELGSYCLPILTMLNKCNRHMSVTELYDATQKGAPFSMARTDRVKRHIEGIREMEDAGLIEPSKIGSATGFYFSITNFGKKVLWTAEEGFPYDNPLMDL